MLGYWLGGVVDDGIPVLSGAMAQPGLTELKHFGAAAASSGDIELYHIPGVTAEATSVAQALAGHTPEQALCFGEREWHETYARLNATGRDRDLQMVMIGCPHANLDQIRDVCRLLDGRRVAEGVALWVFTPRAIREVAERNGYGEQIRSAGGQLMSDTCPAIGHFVPKGTRTFATDSAKQVHYLPAMASIGGWFGTTAECIDGAVAGRFAGGGR